ncbi:hypothetical protein D9M73_198130 [compost metagenome]
MVEVPGHRTGSPQLPLAERHADFGNGAVDVVGHALDDQRHLMRGEPFIGHAMVLHGLAQQARALLDGAIQCFLGHRSFLGLFNHQTQVRVGSNISAIARSNGDFFHQFAEDLALGIGCRFFVFNLPLCAHFSLSYLWHLWRRDIYWPTLCASLYGLKLAIDQKIPTGIDIFTSGCRAIRKCRFTVPAMRRGFVRFAPYFTAVAC